jgi:hypothetical protein
MHIQDTKANAGIEVQTPEIDHTRLQNEASTCPPIDQFERC